MHIEFIRVISTCFFLLFFQLTEGNVVLQLNGVSVDVDVIIKDAAIELNNNEADGKHQEETVVLSETIESSNTDEDASNEKKYDATVSQGSLNTSNGTDNVQCAPTEGDLKVDLTPEIECDVKTEASDSSSIMSLETAASESAASETAASETTASETAASETAALETTTSDAKENQSIGTEKSSGTSENVEEKLQSTSIEASTASEKHHHPTTVHDESTVNTVASSANTANIAAAIIEDANSDSDTDAQSSTTQNGDDKKTNDDKSDEKSDEQTATGDEATKTGSPKKSPKKKSVNKKRKPRTRSQKKEFDYSELTKYNVNVSQRQRRYFVQIPRGRTVPVPGDDCEIFCSNIPINVLEEELIPLFERYGKIWELRLMMSVRNPKRNAGFAFVRFTSNTSANEATEKLNNYEIVPGKLLAVRLSQPNLSLFVGNIHRGLTREQIHEKISNRTSGKLFFLLIFPVIFYRQTHSVIQPIAKPKCLPLFNPFLFFLGLVKTFVKSSLYEDTKNCGFCFLEYDSHSSALKAKRLLNKGNVWGRQLFVDWAQRRKQPEDAELSDSNTLFINYLLKETTDQQITDALSPFGEIEKVTKIKDYAFVSFTEHQAAVDAMNGADKTKLGHEAIEISLAMPKAMKTRTRTRYPSFSFRQPNRPFRRNQSFHQYNQAPGPSNKFYMRKQNRTRADSGTQAAGTANEQTATEVDQNTTVPVVEPATIPVVEQTTIPVDGQTIIPEIDSTMVATNAETLVN